MYKKKNEVIHNFEVKYGLLIKKTKLGVHTKVTNFVGVIRI